MMRSNPAPLVAEQLYLILRRAFIVGLEVVEALQNHGGCPHLVFLRSTIAELMHES